MGSGGDWRALVGSGGLWRALVGSGGLLRALVGSDGLWWALEGSGVLRLGLDSSGGLWRALLAYLMKHECIKQINFDISSDLSWLHLLQIFSEMTPFAFPHTVNTAGATCCL